MAEKEYIEREAAIFEFETNGSNFVYGKKACNAIISRLKTIPAADVVEVVRCRDCDIGTCYSDDSVQCEWSNGFYSDDFCPRGKRKKEGTTEMESLTYDFAANGQHCWQVKGADNALCKEVCRDQGDSGCKDCPIAKAFDRLAAYEDTGLEPDSIEEAKEAVGRAAIELAYYHKAEQEGRLLVLPCAPGAEVWVVERDEDGCAVDVSGYMFLAKAGDAVILTAYVNNLENVQDTLAYHMQETAENYDTDLAVFPADDCYTTREEAEAALGKERDADAL